MNEFTDSQLERSLAWQAMLAQAGKHLPAEKHAGGRIKLYEERRGGAREQTKPRSNDHLFNDFKI